MKSRFSLRILLAVLGLPTLVFGFIGYIILGIINAPTPPPLHGIPLALWFTFAIAWLFFGEFRTKMIKVELKDNSVTIRRFGGLGPSKAYLYSDLDGFKTFILISGASDDEYLYLMKGNKKIAKISSAYHKNYNAMKEEIKTKLPYLGFEKISYASEMKESFT